MNQWDKYFLNICKMVASNSKCLSRQIGAILVRDNIVIATGYNGPPRGMPRCDKRWGDISDPLAKEPPVKLNGVVAHRDTVCPRQALGYGSGERLDLCPAVHAEVNCIASAARLGVSVKGSMLYMNAQIPCSNCMGVLVNAGVTCVIITDLDPYNKLALSILKHSNTTVRTFEGKTLNPLKHLEEVEL